MYRHFYSGRALVLLAALAVPMLSFADRGGFNDRSIRGTWSLFVQGSAAAGNAFGLDPGTDLVAVATVTFDGRGNCESIDQIVAGGMFVPSREGFRDSTGPGGSCVYSVDSNGFGSFDVVFPGAPVTNVTFIITDGRQMRFIANNDGLGIFGGGEMRRQRGGR